MGVKLVIAPELELEHNCQTTENIPRLWNATPAFGVHQSDVQHAHSYQ
jgi:hypothetical protein